MLANNNELSQKEAELTTHIRELAKQLSDNAENRTKVSYMLQQIEITVHNREVVRRQMEVI